MQINQSSVHQTATQQGIKTSLSQAVAGNRPLESITDINSINSNQTVKNNILPGQPSTNDIKVDVEASSLSQQEREQTVEKSGLFEFKGNTQLFDSATIIVSDSQQNQVEYDRDKQPNRGAIDVYLMTQHAAKRDEIQQMVGVDLYA
ncbi:hypothetical protein [Shewanella sp. OMA3-2]|uniref:hypothetical protein n=1 Tax=Shewanella sp. OMA3-2 TaxID=2908650 RepID=UPI001F265446|nr:hypothetical protein [Shewanella sp. OMA3-2]UJF20611.1 hypothetical protein L0B17_10370 [Shewanella sp. OMA3-2]